MAHRILVVNPGSTTTKIALYEDETQLWRQEMEHTLEELAGFDTIYDQFSFRKALVMEALDSHGVNTADLSCVVGRGGILPPIQAGGYVVDERMKQLLREGAIAPHASNLGGLIAAAIAEPAGKPVYIYDAVSADEFEDIARITGMPEILRYSICHVLNAKAVARKYAARMGKSYEKTRLIVAHLGGGITISAHKGGRIVDSLADDSGPFAPERSGSIPVLALIDMFYDSKLTKKEMIKKVRGAGGLKALLGTSDCREVERRIQAGDERARLVYEALIYQVAKGIGLLAPVLKGNVDAVILTGGVAHSDYFTSRLKEYVGFIAPVEIIPGEFELEALALGGLRIVRGQEVPHRLE